MAAKNIKIKRFTLIFFTLLLFFLFFVSFPSMVDSASAIESCVPIDFGNPPTVGTISAAGEVDCYTFEGVFGNLIRVDAEATSGALSPYWQMLEPGDSVLCDWEIIGPSDCLVSSNGTHKIYVKAFGDVSTGSYSIYVQRLDDPVGCTNVVFGDPPVSGSISAAAQENCYQFSGIAGDVVRLDIEMTSGDISPYWQVLGSDGTVECDWEIISPTDCTLLSSGTHSVMIKDFGGTNTGTYRFYIQRLNSPLGCTGISFGAFPVAGSITLAAQENCYQFSGISGDFIRLDIKEPFISGFTPYIQVVESDGTVECGWEITSPADCTLLSSGTHTIMVRDFSGTEIGSYRLFIQRLNSPLKCINVAYGGIAKKRAIKSAAQENCIQFDGNAGDQVRIYTFKTSNSTLTPRWQVVQPDGVPICDWEFFSPSDCILVSNGMHTIMVRDFSGMNKGEYYISVCTDQTRCRLILAPAPESYAGHDGWIRETNETSNKGGRKNSSATTLRLGDSRARQQFRSILSFTTSSLPDDAVLTRVFLRVKKQGITGGGNPVKKFRGFVVDIKKGFFNTFTILQSVDFQSRANKSIGPFKPALKRGWYTLNLSGAKGKINKFGTRSGLTQIRLRFKLDDNNNSVANFLRLYSGNAAIASRPQLIIEYYIP